MAFALPQVLVLTQQKGIAVVLGAKFQTMGAHGIFGKYAFVMKLPT